MSDEPQQERLVFRLSRKQFDLLVWSLGVVTAHLRKGNRLELADAVQKLFQQISANVEVSR